MGKIRDGLVIATAVLAYAAITHADQTVKVLESTDAKLHLGLTQAQAGRKDDARQTLAGVQGSDGASDLARLWTLTLR